MKNFVEFLKEENDSTISPKLVTVYIDFLEDKYMESSFISKVSSLRQFINWLNLDNNPFWKLKLKLKRGDFKFYSEEELFDNDSADAFNYDAFLTRLLYELYLSFDELTSLNIEDYNHASASLKVRSHWLRLSDKLESDLKYYVKNYRQSLLGDRYEISLQDPLLLKVNFQQDYDSISDLRLTSFDIYKLLAMANLKNIYLKRSRIINLFSLGKSPDEIESMLAIKLSDFYKPYALKQGYRLLTAYNEFHPRAARNIT